MHISHCNTCCWLCVVNIVLTNCEQKTQWPKEKVQKDKQRPTKHTYKTKDRVTRINRPFICI